MLDKRWKKYVASAVGLAISGAAAYGAVQYGVDPAVTKEVLRGATEVLLGR